MLGIFNDCFPPIMDGVSVTVQNYARWLNRKCNNVCVVTPSVPGTVYDEEFPVYNYFSLPYPCASLTAWAFRVSTCLSAPV